jgi:parallel beta-helix repeat protein
LGRFAFTGAASTNNGTISNNTFSNNLADGLQGGIQNTTISGNTFSGNGRHGLALTGFSGSVSPDSTRGAINTLVLSNTFTGNGFASAGAGISFNAFQFAGTIATNQAHFNRIRAMPPARSTTAARQLISRTTGGVATVVQASAAPAALARPMGWVARVLPISMAIRGSF